MPCKSLIKELAIIIGVSLITAFTVNTLSPRGIALFGSWDTSKGVISARAKNDAVMPDLELHDPDEVVSIYEKGDAVFIDARAKDFYDLGHIAGAVNMPLVDVDSLLPGFMEQYPSDTHLITYCSGRECDDSHELAQMLIARGYTNVQVFIDGFPAWETGGNPVE